MSECADDDADKESKRLPTRKKYAAPVLIKWGTLRDLTEAVGSTGASDSGKKNGQKQTR